MAHQHLLLFIREFTGNHKIYWCRDCGLLMEVFSDTFAELIPEWSKDRLLKEDRTQEAYSHVHHKPKKQTKRLGKGLRDMILPKASSLLINILNNDVKDKDE